MYSQSWLIYFFFLFRYFVLRKTRYLDIVKLPLAFSCIIKVTIVCFAFVTEELNIFAVRKAPPLCNFNTLSFKHLRKTILNSIEMIERLEIKRFYRTFISNYMNKERLKFDKKIFKSEAFSGHD